MGLAQENGFGLAYLQNFAVAGKSHRAAMCTSTKECNKFDLTTAQCF
jgi:hypothetical protein